MCEWTLEGSELGMEVQAGMTGLPWEPVPVSERHQLALISLLGWLLRFG